MILRTSYPTPCMITTNKMQRRTVNMQRRTLSVRLICGSPPGKAGFTLLEVILALAILLGAIAVLGELARLGMNNAKLTQDLTRAQVLCKSKMAEITSGIAAPDSIQQTAFDDIYQDSDVRWLYSVGSEVIDQDGLLAVQVTVSQDLPAAQRPTSFTLVQWMIDPNTELATASTATSNTSDSGTQNTTP